MAASRATLVALPWWAFMGFLGYVIVVVQRLRLRVTEIDLRR